MAFPREATPKYLTLIGATLACSALALGTAFAQGDAPSAPVPATDAASEAAAPDAAAESEGAAGGAPDAAPDSTAAEQTEGQRGAAEAAAALAAGEADEPVILEAPEAELFVQSADLERGDDAHRPVVLAAVAVRVAVRADAEDLLSHGAIPGDERADRVLVMLEAEVL